MKKVLFVALVATALAGCATLPASIPSGPAPIADRTEIDERALVGFEAAYKAARSLAEVGADSGQIDAARAKQIAAVDTALYAALGKARTAYAAANAATYRDALAEIGPLAAQLFQLVGGSPQ